MAPVRTFLKAVIEKYFKDVTCIIYHSPANFASLFCLKFRGIHINRIITADLSGRAILPDSTSKRRLGGVLRKPDCIPRRKIIIIHMLSKPTQVSVYACIES